MGQLSDRIDAEDFFPKWTWYVAFGLAAACTALIVLYYFKHPERNIFEDFTRKPFVDIPATNGAVPAATAPTGADVVEGEAPGY